MEVKKIKVNISTELEDAINNFIDSDVHENYLKKIESIVYLNETEAMIHIRDEEVEQVECVGEFVILRTNLGRLLIGDPHDNSAWRQVNHEFF